MRIEEAFKYCPRCKNDFEVKEFMLFCSNCELKQYLNPKPCTNIILQNKDKQLLLAIRKNSPHKGKYAPPGGFTKINETLEECIRREILEELSLDLPEVKFFKTKFDFYTYNEIDYPILLSYFTAEVDILGKLKVSDDISGYRWFDRDSIPFDKMGFRSDREVFKEFLESNNEN